MKRLALVAFLAVAGCGSATWQHPTKTQADFQKDAYDCEQVAYQYAANLGPRFAGNPLIVVDEKMRCMQLKHGWSRQAAPVAPTAGSAPTAGAQGFKPVITEFSCPPGTRKTDVGCVSQ